MLNNIKQLTKQLVQCESTHANSAEVSKTADIFSEFFGDCVERRDSKKSKVLSVLFVPKGIKMPRVLLMGHMDVVNASAKAFRCTQKEDRLYGRGTYDMKGPTAALAVAMKKILKKNPKASIGLLITGDEERGGAEGAGQFVQDHLHQLPEIVFNPDGGNAFTLVTEEKGVLFIEVEVFGKTAHASRPWEGKNALTQAAQGMIALQKMFAESKNKTSWKTTVVPTMINGGIAGNQIPDKVTVKIDIRYIPADTQKDILRRIKKCFIGSTVRTLKHAEPFSLCHDASLIRDMQSCARDVLGKTLPLERYHSSCDARFFSAQNIPVIIMRPLGGGAHSENEWVSLKGLEQYAQFIERWVETKK